MSRKRTGLKNKWRSGQGSYSRKRKSRTADNYGRFESGKFSDTIAGRNITYKAIGQVVIS